MPRKMAKRRTSGAQALILVVCYGTAKPVPFVQESFSADSKARHPLTARLKGCGKCRFGAGGFPQRLKPNSLQSDYVRAEARTL
jgi:hypothetical protein